MKRGRKTKQLVDDEFQNVVAAAQTDELKTRVVSLSRGEEDILKAKAEDQQLNDAKDLAKELNTPYAEGLKVMRARRRFVLKVLQERGEK